MAGDGLYEAMIKKAIRLARKAEGRTSPNPMVGAVLFDRDGVIATGYHQQAGQPHAEIVALRKAGRRARGASLAVNLEPCCHFGRTGPCTDAIIAAGVKKVIYSIEDPFHLVRGRGARILAAHGIEIVRGIGRDEAIRLNEVYLHYIATGRPFVALKLAQSLDGRIATRTGQSQWISSTEALAFGHRLRAGYDAVAVGSGTVRVDNPKLTVRRVKGPNPLRIVLTASPDLPAKMRVFASENGSRTVVATTRKNIADGAYSFAETWPIRKGPDGLDLDDLLKQAGDKGVTSILFEGGGRLATALLRRKLVNKLYFIVAPTIIGQGVASVGDLGVTALSESVGFKDFGHRKLGTDILFWGYPRR